MPRTGPRRGAENAAAAAAEGVVAFDDLPDDFDREPDEVPDDGLATSRHLEPGSDDEEGQVALDDIMEAEVAGRFECPNLQEQADPPVVLADAGGDSPDLLAAAAAGHPPPPPAAEPVEVRNVLLTAACLYVCFDLECTGASRLVHAICELGAVAFAVAKPRAKSGSGRGGAGWTKTDAAEIEKIDDMPTFESLIKPEPHNWDEGIAGTGTHGIKPEHVEGAPPFSEVWAAFVAWMEVERLKNDCECICLVAHNGKAYDLNWVGHMLDREEKRGNRLEMPSTVRFFWDTLQLAGTASEFKLSKAGREAGKTGKLGNKNHSLGELYYGITKEQIEGAHRVGADARANAIVAMHPALWSRRLNKGSGIVRMADYFAGLKEKIKAAREKLTPDLSGTGWEYVTPPESPSKLPPAHAGGGAWGPKGDAKKIYDTLDEMFLTFAPEALLESVARWSNYYAAEQPVRLIGQAGAKTRRFAPCEVTDEGSEGQQYRWGGDLKDWDPITKWHVMSVFGVLTRASSHRMSSPGELWAGYGSFGDDLVKEKVSRGQFLWVMRWLTFADHEAGLETFTGKDEKEHVAKDAKVKPWLDALQKRARGLWDCGQCVAVDEACCKCKSKFCSIKQRNPAKPIRMHVKIYCMCCAESGFLYSHKVYRGAGSGSVAEAVVDQLFDVAWDSASKVVFMDNWFAPFELSHGLLEKHGAYSATMVAVPSRKDDAQRKIGRRQYPFRKPSTATADGLKRGWSQMAKCEGKYNPVGEAGEAGGPPKTYTRRAVLWKDTKLTGVLTNWFKGFGPEFTVPRRLRKKKGESSDVPAFEAIIWYLANYGAVDSFDALMRQYPTDFKTGLHWYRRLAWWGLDSVCCNMWIVLQYNMGWTSTDDQPATDKDDRVAGHFDGKDACYCEPCSNARKSKTTAQGRGTKKHRCYSRRVGLSPRQKFQSDLGRALIERAGRELAKGENTSFTMRPRRKRHRAAAAAADADFASPPSRPQSAKRHRAAAAAADADFASPPSRPQSAKRPRQSWNHGEGAHTHRVLETGWSRPCSYCKKLVKAGIKQKATYCRTGCKQCVRQTVASNPGVFVCADCWDTPEFALWHEAKFPKDLTKAMLPGDGEQ